MASTARKEDFNGWYEVKGNPLSKVGVFPYSGAQLGLTGDEAEKIFQVLRPAEELASPECIASFKLLPWVDDHTLLGKEADGLTPAEQKGVHGVIGEDVYFDEPYLRGNIKVFSDQLGQQIDEGKTELSCGYRCKYDMTAGTYQGQHYDAVQRQIRGNHLSLVTEGRMGKDVAVLDHFTFTVDKLEAIMPEATAPAAVDAEPVTLESLAAKLEAVMAFLATLKPKEEAEHGELPALPSADAPAAEPAAPAAAAPAAEDACAAADSAAAIKLLQAKIARLEKAQSTGMDSAEVMKQIGQRDRMAQALSYHIGAFDSASMTLDAVAKYGTKKLGIDCPAGQEIAALAGYLHSRPVSDMVAVGDSSNQASELDAYLS